MRQVYRSYEEQFKREENLAALIVTALIVAVGVIVGWQWGEGAVLVYGGSVAGAFLVALLYFWEPY